MISETLQWDDFKAYADAHEVSIQELSLASGLVLAVVRDPFVIRCFVTSGSSEESDYIANYRPTANHDVVKKISQSLGTDDYFISPRMIIFTAQPGANIFTKQLDEALAIRGGILYMIAPSHGDWITVEVTDEDNLLGYGAGFVLSSYVPEWAVMAGQNELTDVSIGKLPIPGLYLKLTYNNAGSVSVDGSLNLISYTVGA